MSHRPGERARQRGTIFRDWRAGARARLVPAGKEVVADHRYIVSASEGAAVRFCDRTISRDLSARLAVWVIHIDRGSLHRCIVVTTRRSPPRDHVVTVQVARSEAVVGLSWSPHRCKVIRCALFVHDNHTTYEFGAVRDAVQGNSVVIIRTSVQTKQSPWHRHSTCRSFYRSTLRRMQHMGCWR